MVDSQNNNINDLELLSLLGEIDRKLTECQNVLLVRDINCDFSRPTHFVQSIRTFAEGKGKNIFWNLSDNDCIEEVSYKYISYPDQKSHFVLKWVPNGPKRIFYKSTFALRALEVGQEPLGKVAHAEILFLIFDTLKIFKLI